MVTVTLREAAGKGLTPEPSRLRGEKCGLIEPQSRLPRVCRGAEEVYPEGFRGTEEKSRRETQIQADRH